MNQLIEQAQEWVINEGVFRMIEHIIVLVVVLKFIRAIFRIESRGKQGLVSYLTKLAIRISGKVGFVRNKMEDYLEKESTKNAEEAFNKKEVKLTYKQLPEKGLSKEQIIAILDKRVNADIDPTLGKTFAYVYEHSK
jgi:L-cystine uptake protein TcyP (sodium:dicarboxylate symporter family)